MYKSPQCFLPSFKSAGILVQEKKRKIDFQDGGAAILVSNWKDFRSITQMLPTSHPDASYQVSTGLLVQEKKQK